MPSYMYTSATGSNWDDDDEDFAPCVYKEAAAEFQAAITLADARLALQKLEGAIEDQPEPSQLSETTAAQPQVDHSIYPDETPSYINHILQHWSSDHRRPAYVALSNERGFMYPSQRRNYSANWKATKLRMGSSMKNTMMMMPSPLRLSKTWSSDSMGEFIEDRGYLGLLLPSSRLPTPRLCHENESDEERDEVHTPPDTPTMARYSDCEVEVGEYDPVTGAIDLPPQEVESWEAMVERELVDFAEKARCCGAAEQDQSDDDSSEAALLGLVSTEMAQPTQDIAITTSEASVVTPSFAEETSRFVAAAYNRPSQDQDDTSTSSEDSTYLASTPTLAVSKASPDFQCSHGMTKTELLWNGVTVGCFALSSLPWGRMAVAAAGTLVDVVTFVARS